MKNKSSDIIEKKLADYLVRVDRKKCLSFGKCVGAVPELYILDEKQLCSFKKDVKKVNTKNLMESYYLCPVGAIYIYDKNGKQIIP